MCCEPQQQQHQQHLRIIQQQQHQQHRSIYTDLQQPHTWHMSHSVYWLVGWHEGKVGMHFTCVPTHTRRENPRSVRRECQSARISRDMAIQVAQPMPGDELRLTCGCTFITPQLPMLDHRARRHGDAHLSVVRQILTMGDPAADAGGATPR
eukprot:2185668-Alexandrium_andersonii.AAC.1